ncbi:hypothetical protein BPNPMPFG_006907 (plasmid) [Mesorhizobium sp. AR07]|uniref:hypothetical protein n=1 Tax=Mesorhizobium sp. AR07 TaxID=2865838 RepID=UPI002160BAE5|nr:hypothetical protein [Mesorhizobium sp. AR07]UVK49179.1 hypothetical protein BPNPMPFG_006907 [Mesorhizobium sp. AR07]
MKAAIGLALTFTLAAALLGCAYKPLKAPCSSDESGAPLAYADPAAAPALSPAQRFPDSCGPMKSI